MSEETSALLQNGPQQEYSDQRDGQTESQSGSHKESTPSYWVFFVPMAIGIFLPALDQTLVVSSYATIGSELKELQKTSWIATSYLLTITCVQPLYGKLSDIFGRKSCLLFSYTLFALGCLLCGLSRNMNELIASRALTGIGGGGMQTIVSIIMSDVVPLRSRGTWQGVMNLVWASGNATGASLGGYLADTIGWRWSFIIQVPLTLLAIASVTFALHLPNLDNANLWSKLRRVDFSGAIALVLTMLSLLIGLDRVSNASWNDRLAIAFLSAFIVFGLAFMIIEMKVAKEPFAPQRIIINRALIASYMVNLFGLASMFCIIFHVPLFFQAVIGKTASESGLWLILSVVGSVSGSLSSGLIMQSTGKYYILTVMASTMLAVGSITMTLSSGAWTISILGLVSGLFISSLGSGTVITTSLISLIANAGQEDQAIAIAVSYLFRSTGSVLGVSIGSALLQDTLRSSLRAKLSGNDVDEIVHRVRESLVYLDELDPLTRSIVKISYGEAIQMAFRFSAVLAIGAWISSLFIKEKPLSRS
ncbi:member of the major facilitator superfamily [Crepidotus variabilis]|uniref:Member of the major facilitator superfamily n=1 Tax=Crepidotus variabilis TaxID=179855 RepID=A0A9P6JKK9_9AGAR|nr:member of the major facilitator superfamily [Crepidotus variabilis]